MIQRVGRERCGGCRAVPGQRHEELCDWAHCPICGGQFLGCGEHYPDAPMSVWQGKDPEVIACEDWGWRTSAAGIDHPVGDHTRLHIAFGRGEVAWDRDLQRWIKTNGESREQPDHD